MKYFILPIALFLIFNLAAAHSGVSFERQAGEYFIDIGSENETVAADEEFELNFSLSKNDEGQDFDDVSVKFVKNKKVVYSARIHKPKLGPVHLLYVFPEGGEYEMSVKFNKDDQTIVESSFPVTVSKKPEEAARTAGSPLDSLFGAVIGFVIGFIVVSLSIKKRK